MDKVLYGIAALAAVAGVFFLAAALWSNSQPILQQSEVVRLNVTSGLAALGAAIILAAIGRALQLLERIAVKTSAR
jgi:hypothetical protein